VVTWLAPRIPLVSVANVYLTFGATLVVGIVSWHLIERPINALKRRFPYVRRAAAEEPATLRKAA
jgi:peptidoglycan/LPS O-acetylase OafA/YrhL